MLARSAEAALVRIATMEEIHMVAGVGGCGCGGGTCGTCMPQPIERYGKMFMPRGWAPTAEQVADPQWMRMAVALGCITEIFSDVITVPAGTTVRVNVQPSQDCFFMLQERIVVVSDADPQQTARARYGRAFKGDCVIDCQNLNAFTDFKDTDDCQWCPTRQLNVGRTTDTKQYSRDIQALAGMSVQAQIGLRGVCYEDNTCPWPGWGGSCGGNGNGGGAGAGAAGSYAGGGRTAA